MRFAFLVFLLGAGLVACGGGGGGGGGSLPSTGGGTTGTGSTPTPSPSPAASSSMTVGLSTSSTTVATFSGVSGISGATVTVPAITTTGTTATLTLQSSLPNGDPAPAARAFKGRAIIGGTNLTPLAYVTLALSNTSTISSTPAFSFTLPGTVTGNAYIGIYDGSGTWSVLLGPGTIDGDTVTFAAESLAPPYTLTAGTTYTFALVTSGTLITPSPSPTASASASSSSSPTASPTHSPTSSPTASPTSAPTSSVTTAPNTCSQTPAPGSQSGGVTSNESGFFSALSNAGSSSQVCISAWEPSSTVYSDLKTAATNHAAVTVIFPIEEYSADASDATTLAGLGARIIWENDDGSTQSVGTGQSLVTASLPIHAKFAFVNGVAYMDGHNWFTSDPILVDANSADYTAMQTDLTTFPSSPGSVASTAFTTDKYASLQAEAAFITAASPGSGDTVDFISEDFEDYGPSPSPGGSLGTSGPDAPAVYNALLAAAQNGATVNVIAEGPSSGFDAYENCDLSTLANAGAHVYAGSGGSEKMTLITSGGMTTGWIGSSNLSAYDYIDWGMTITSNSTVISSMQSYYATALSGASSYTEGSYYPSCSL